MSTRSVVAKPEGDGWRGRYVHSDGYPTGVGACLWEGFHVHFHRDLEAMVDALVEAERVGWSALCGYDLTLPGQWSDPDYREPIDWEAEYRKGPKSYTARGEQPHHPLAHAGAMTDDPGGDWIASSDSDWWGTEWAYVLSAGGLVIFTVGYRDPPAYVDLIPWDIDPEVAAKRLKTAEEES